MANIGRRDWYWRLGTGCLSNISKECCEFAFVNFGVEELGSVYESLCKPLK